MAIQGVVTNIALSNFILAENNEGFLIHPTSFSVSEITSTLDPTRTTPNGGVWYTGPISSRVVVDYNTVKFICTIPPGAIPPSTFKFIREIYIFGQDPLNVDFLMVIGQPSTAVLYDPSGSVTLELEMALTNVDLSSTLVFNFTQATEVGEHNLDCNAHPELLAAVNKAGIHLTAPCNQPFDYLGQSFDEKAEFEGTKATFTHGGITFTATYNGTELNGATVTFNNIKTTDQVRSEFNAANPNATIEHNDFSGALVLPSAVKTFAGGSYLVDDKNVVYKDTDNIYKKALADGTIKSRVAGIADRSRRIVRSQGFITATTGFSIGSELFLSNTVPGTIVNSASSIKLGVQTGTNYILLGSQGGGGGGADAGFDAVVTDVPGFKHYSTTQDAIDDVSDGSKILIDKLEYVTDTITNGSKRIDFWFNGPETGWSKYLGTAEKQTITFSAVPTSGTWRIEWNSQTTADLAYNASTTDIANAINALSGPGLPVTVTGTYATGFDVIWTSLIDVPQITFNDPGLNEIQRFQFSAVPDDGTIRFDFDSQITSNLAWNDDALLLELYLEALSNISDVTVTGSFASQQFIIEYVGADGKTPKNSITVSNNTLALGVTPVGVTHTVLQEGRYPASNLKVGTSNVLISVSTIQGGSLVGPNIGFLVGKNYTRFIGLGKVENFDIGLDLNGKIGVDTELLFTNTVTPIDNTSLIPNVDFHTEKSFGLPRQKLRTVGTYGDYADLWSAVAAATSGDKIIVFNDQSLTSPQIINKEIEIEFTHQAQINVDSVISGTLLTLGTRTRTKHLRLNIYSAGTYDVAVKLYGIRGYHEDLTVLMTAGITLTTAFEVDSSASAVYCNGVLVRGTGIITNGLLNNSTYANHDIVIRDVEAGLTYDTGDRINPNQSFLGVGDGITSIFTLPEAPFDEESVLLMLDGIPRLRDTHWNLVSGFNVQFMPGFIPATGQKVSAFYFPKGPFKTPPRHLEVYDDLTEIGTNVKRITFGSGLTASLTGTGEILVDSSDVSYYINGTRISPVLITTTGLAPFNTYSKELMFLEGNGGPIIVTANPQITSGTVVGQELILIGNSSLNTVELSNGSGLILADDIVLGLNSILSLIWDGSSWVELYRDTPSVVSSITGSITTTLNDKVNKSGDTMTGALTLSGLPSADYHAVPRIYVERIYSLYDAIVGSALQVSSGAATHSTISSAITAFPNGKILVLPGTYVETVNISTDNLYIEGRGRSTTINGDLNILFGAEGCSVSSLKVDGDISFNLGANYNFIEKCWQSNGHSLTDNGTSNSITLIQE